MTTTMERRTDLLNDFVAERLEEIGQRLEEQGANHFRVQAYRTAAMTIRNLNRGVDDVLDEEGLAGLDRLPGIGPALARVVDELVTTGQLPMLERLRGRSDPIHRLASVPGVGLELARTLYNAHDIETLEQLEVAAHDGTLARIAGFGDKKVAAIREVLATRLGRRSRHAAAPTPGPSVEELLEVDRLYRDGSDAGTLPLIAPRRFNPAHEHWLPVLHLTRGPWHYTALFSNTARAHELQRTQDWVVIYFERDGVEGQCTVVTATSGALAGKRVVRGRERDCTGYDAGHA